MELNEVQQKLIDRVAAENGLSDYQLVKSPGSIKGDNFLGILTAITLTDKEKTLELILKSAHTNEAFRKAAPVHGFYDREIYSYRRIFEEFKKFQEDNNIADPFNSTAKMYGYCIDDTEECLIMENLKTVGYQLWDKRIPMNPEHVRAVLIEYAKFHAVSFAMKQKNPKLFDHLVEPIYKNVFESEMMNNEDKLTAYIKAVMENGYKAMADDVVLMECLKRIETKVHELFSDAFKKEEYKLVVSHGDCWCNNFLFKYQGSKNIKTPASLRILDWQLSSLTTPVHDICYFLLTNSCQEILDDSEAYLQLYYDTLKKQLKKFNCDVEELYPYSTYREQLRQYMVFGVHMAIMILKLVECNQDEVPDFAETGDITSSMNFDDFQTGSKLSSLRIIDWQLSTITSPANDICYFLFANSSKLVLENYEIYLKLYHDTLSDQLRDFDCNPEEIFPYSLFERHFKVFTALGAYTSIIIFKMMNSESEEAPDFAENMENDGFIEQFGLEIKNFGGYIERLKILLKILNDNNLV